MAFKFDMLRNIAQSTSQAASSATALASRLLEQSDLKQRSEQLAATYPDTLTSKLQQFQQSLQTFNWPITSNLWRQARLVVADQGLADQVSSDLRWDDGSVSNTDSYSGPVRTNRFYSKSFDANAVHDLDAGTYLMSFSMGGTTGDVSLTVDADDVFWSDVLDKFADAVNGLDLPVQAEIVRQTVSEEIKPGMMSTGTMVALTVDAAYEDDLFIDRTEFLPREFDFTAPITPAGDAPTVMAHSVHPYQRAIPSRYYSDIYDPNAATTLSQGEHFFSYSTGAESGTISVNVDSGDTWEDVLVKTANSLNSAQDDFKAAVMGADRYEYVQAPGDEMRRIRATGVQLTLEGVQPKLGEAISFGFGAATDSVTAFHDPTAGLPAETAGTSYIATATANGWTAGNIYTLSTGPTSWEETAPSTGDARYVSGLLANYRYNGSAWETAENFVTQTGLDVTAWPGQDGEVAIDGATMNSASNTYSVDDGHLLVGVEESGGESLSLKVVEAMDQVERAMTGVVNSYNGLTRFLNADAAQWRGDFRSQWGGPVAQRREQLEWMGVRELSDNSMLWVDADRFFTALSEDPDRAGATLWGTSEDPGLVPEWESMTRDALARGAEYYFSGAPETPKFPWRTGDLEEESDSIILDRSE